MTETVVLKFGGAAVATPESFGVVAKIIAEKHKTVDRIAVVVSAMGDSTDDLIALAKKVNPNPPQREMDMLVSVGERISISLLAMALAKIGVKAISFTGSQTGIITSICHNEAKIIDMRPHRLLPYLDRGEVVIVAGFQGVSLQGEITTLGRGGSDTTAVALGVALSAGHVEFYKDVDGIFDRDPKKYPDAKRISRLSFAEAYELMRNGAQVLHDRCVLLAEQNALPLSVRAFAKAADVGLGTWIGPDVRIGGEHKYES